MKFSLQRILSLLTAVFASLQTASAAPTPDDRAAVHWIAQEIASASILDQLTSEGVRGSILIHDVSVVDVAAGKILSHQSVVVHDGRIAFVGDVASEPRPPGAFRIDGKGLFLSPGLSDMHVHTQSLGEQILRLSVGETSYREMDGFPWMLRLRRILKAGSLVAPNAYIAGTIIADQPLYGWAVVVHNEDEARKAVNDQAACGYDFVKVHNSLSQSLLDVVARQAHRVGKDVVGHIPHDISVDHAVHVAGMRTLEHLKGFINDRDFSPDPEDFANALKGAQVWLTPTFYIMRPSPTSAEAHQELGRPEMRFVRAARRAEFAEVADVSPDWRQHLSESLPSALRWLVPATPQQRINRALAQVMPRLLPLHPHWLAGTDSAQYNLQIPGVGLIDELHLMELYGIARVDVVRAATSEPAAAMRRAKEFGQVKEGMRADLLLLAANPLDTLSAYDINRGVMVRGVWLGHEALMRATSALVSLYAQPDSGFVLDAKSAAAVAEGAAALSARDIALDPRMLRPAIAALQRAGYRAAGENLADTITDDRPGPCRETLPE